MDRYPGSWMRSMRSARLPGACRSAVNGCARRLVGRAQMLAGHLLMRLGTGLVTLGSDTPQSDVVFLVVARIVVAVGEASLAALIYLLLNLLIPPLQPVTRLKLIAIAAGIWVSLNVTAEIGRRVRASAMLHQASGLLVPSAAPAVVRDETGSTERPQWPDTDSSSR